MNWKEIWNKKGSKKELPAKYSIKDLMDLNGFNDTGVTFESYKTFWEYVTNKFVTKDNSSFYEIGCGSGISLKILHDMGHVVGGSDYAQNSIPKALGWEISDDIECLEALKVSITPKYDYVVSFSVFHYFKDIEEANEVTKIMLEKCNKGIGIFDICDESKRDIYIETRKKADPNYDEKYKGLDHLFIQKEFWKEFAKENNLNLIIEDQHIENYKNSELRYNVYLTKK